MKLYSLVLATFIFILCSNLCAQSLSNNNSKVETLDTTKKVNNLKTEIFTSGFIDIMNSGQVNASARFIRLFIGEPDKFAIPLSIYGGISNNNFQSNGGGKFLKFCN